MLFQYRCVTGIIYVRNASYGGHLLLFIFSIYRYWNNAVWGNGGLWSAVGRLITATVVLIAWPEIYHYTIMLANGTNDVFASQIATNPDKLGQTVVTWIVTLSIFQATRDKHTGGYQRSIFTIYMGD